MWELWLETGGRRESEVVEDPDNQSLGAHGTL